MRINTWLRNRSELFKNFESQHGRREHSETSTCGGSSAFKDLDAPRKGKEKSELLVPDYFAFYAEHEKLIASLPRGESETNHRVPHLRSFAPGVVGARLPSRRPEPAPPGSPLGLGSSSSSAPVYHVVKPREAALRLTVLLLLLEDSLGNASSTGVYDKDVSQSRTTWCEETNACLGCEGKNSLRCLEPGVSVMDADLCGCCFSCVAVRDLGESCASQLSVWPEVSELSPVLSSVKILATTWCGEGLVCVNFVCHDLGANDESVKLPWLNINEGFIESRKNSDALNGLGQQDVNKFHAKAVDPIAERSQLTTAHFNEQIFNDHDSNDSNLQKTVPSTSITLTQSPKETQRCYAGTRKTMTISSHQSDDRLGRIETILLYDKRFQLVYTGDMLSELEILLNIVDRRHEDSLFDEREVDSLVDGFLNLLFPPDDEDLSDDQSPTDSEKTAYFSNPQNFAFLSPRGRREVQRREDDLVSLDAPKNIEDILIRGASAHREYFAEARGEVPDANIANKSASVPPIETLSQGDESTVRVHITSRPRKVHTLIDLEEGDEEEEIDVKEQSDLQLANKGHVKNVGRLSPLADEEPGVSPGVPRPLGATRTTERDKISQKTAEYEAPDISQVLNTQLNETLMKFDNRLSQVEVRTDVLETVLEKIAKWCNLGVLSMTRDCLIPQNSEIHHERWRPDTEERLALASGLETVQFPGKRRKSSGIIPQRNGYHHLRVPGAPRLAGITAARQIDHRRRDNPLNQNVFRTITNDGLLGRRPISGHSGTESPAVKSPCGNPVHRGSSWRKPIADVTGELPVHGTVQRSVSSTNPFRSGSSEFKRSKRDVQIVSRDHLHSQNFGNLQETRTPMPVTLTEKITMVRKLENQENQIFPLGWASAKEITSSSVSPSWETFISDEKKKESEEKEPSVPNPESRLGKRAESAATQPWKLVSQKNAGRIKRWTKSMGRISGPYVTLGKIHPGSSVTTRRARISLFEREKSTTKEPGLDSNRNMWRGSIIAEKDDQELAIPLIVLGESSDLHNSPSKMGNQLLYKNSEALGTPESTASTISMNSKEVHEVLDSRLIPYSITTHENPTIRIEEISDVEYEDVLPQFRGSSAGEDDFDHIYESVEAEAEGGDFEYHVAYDQVEYVDGSSVEIITEMPSKLEEPEAELKSRFNSPREEIRRVLFRHERNRRAAKNYDDQWESVKQTKPELPLLLFGSTGKHHPKTIVWPSKWIGHRRDRIQGSGGSGDKERAINSRFLTTRPMAIATPSLPTKTAESLIIGSRLGDGETNYVVTPRITGFDRRARKSRRKLVWR